MPTVQGQASAAATSVAIPTHAAGDLIIVMARGTAAAPSVPAAGGTVPAWVTLQSGIANSMALTVVAFVATGSTHTTGAFTNATHICVLVLRPTTGKRLQTSAADSSVGNGNNTQTIIYPALTLNSLSGSSFGVRVGTRGVAITAVGTAPTGWTNQTVQPAGASALMSVHTRAALVANPTADTVTTTSSNAAYRAVTIEVEELTLTVDFAASVAGAAAVAVQAGPIRNVAAAISDAAVVTADLAIPISFAIVIATNQPYAGEHLSGEFLAGDEDVLAVDMIVIRISALDAVVAGQAAVATSLSVTRGLVAGVTGQASVTAQENPVRGFAAALAGTGAVTVQDAITRAIAASIAGAGVVAIAANKLQLLAVPVVGQGAVTVDLIRVPVGVNLDASIQGQAAVAADLQVTPPSGASILFSADLVGKATVGADLRVNPGWGIQVQGQGQVAVGFGRIISFGCTVQGQGQVSVGASKIQAFSIPISGSAVVISQTTRIVPFEALIMTTIPICGEHLVGTFICGGSSGPHSVIYIDLVRAQLALSAVPIQGQAQVLASMAVTRSLQTLIAGQASVVAQLGLRLALAALIQGQAQVLAKMRIAWLTETEPGDILLPPTTEVPWILIPTTNGSATLLATEEEAVLLDPTEEEDWLLIPTIERG